MAYKPSQKNHRMKPMEGLNLTPFIDMITCLMFFLLMFAAVIPVVIIDAPLPKIASTADEIKKAKEDTNKLDLMVYINANALIVKPSNGGEKSFPKIDKDKFDYDEFHKYLVTVKTRNPNTKELTLMPSDDVPYEVMIQVMDASRELLQTDAGYQKVPPEIANNPESQQFNRLFPDVSIGGV